MPGGTHGNRPPSGDAITWIKVNPDGLMVCRQRDLGYKLPCILFSLIGDEPGNRL